MPRIISWIARAPILVAVLSAIAFAEQPPRIETNESYIQDLNRSDDFDIADMKAVFAFVLNSLPDRVKVYPTENYYYFKFHHRGMRYDGNIRLENESRDQGKVHFAYGPEGTQWRESSQERFFHILLDRSHGVTVEKIDRLTYRVSHAGKSVVFELNDLSTVAPPPGLLRAEERYIGPVFDESGIRFFLLYNAKLKLFLYLLDGTVPVPDEFFPSRITERILIGKRTGFAFYRDHTGQRKILIGVFEGNVRINNYFDGPFDQLPDNFIEGEALRSAILEVNPSLKGKIDRYGSTFDGKIRFMIAPYISYWAESDLAPVHKCATSKRDGASYYRCFATGEGPPRADQAPPRRTKR